VAAQAAPVASASAPQLASAAPGSGYVVQVLAQNSEADAQSSFRSMQARYPNQLGGLQPIIRRKDVNGGVKYGAQVGPYGSREEALKLCEDLKAAGGSCFVAKN
jgi:septal ring-binding cell division protein DamX